MRCGGGIVRDAAFQQGGLGGQLLRGAIGGGHCQRLPVVAAPNGDIALAGADCQRGAVGFLQFQGRGGVRLAPFDGAPCAAVQVQPIAAGQVILAGMPVILDAAGRIQHKHVGKLRGFAGFGVGQRGAVGVQLGVATGAGIVDQLVGAVGRERNAQRRAVLRFGQGGGVLGKAEQRCVFAVGGRAVKFQPGAHAVGGGVKAVFLAVACQLAVGVKGEGGLADVQAVHILIRQRVQQVGGIDIFADMHRHGVQRQGKLQQQVAGFAHGTRAPDFIRAAVQRQHTGGGAHADALHQHIRRRNAPLGLRAVDGAQRHRHGAAACKVRLGGAGQRVKADRLRRCRLGRGFCRGGRGGGCRRRGGRCPCPAARQQGERQQQ